MPWGSGPPATLPAATSLPQVTQPRQFCHFTGKTGNGNGCFWVRVTEAPQDFPGVQGPSKDNQAVTKHGWLGAESEAVSRSLMTRPTARPAFVPGNLSLPGTGQLHPGEGRVRHVGSGPPRVTRCCGKP